jgi:dipeptidyl aminopeptidase/acylaminoacyl peptidase
LAGVKVVDPQRLGIVGYSRGALAAAILATELPDCRAAVLGAGVYDFQSAYDSAAPGIRANIESEAGLSPEAIAARSPVARMDKLSGALLILHGDGDANAPVEQAYLLRDKLSGLGKDFEIKIFTGAEHSIGILNFRQSSLDFLGRKL